MANPSLSLLPPMDIIYGAGGAGPSYEHAGRSMSPEAENEDDVPIYESHGKWACMRSLPLDKVTRLKHLSEGPDSRVFLECAEVDGRRLGMISKLWDVWREWHGFYAELFVYASPRHLRPFQGIYVPRIIGVYATNDGFINVAMETPHGSTKGWTEADPLKTPTPVKEKFVRAYEEIHAAGILHGDVELRHLLVTDEDDICIIDWQNARSINPVPEVDLRKCTPAELDWEMRRLKYLLDFEDARLKEVALWKETDRETYLEYERLREIRDAEDKDEVQVLPDEEWDEEEEGPLRIDPRSDEWFVAMDARLGGRRFDIPPFSFDGLDVFLEERQNSPGAPLMLPILLPSSQPSPLSANPPPVPQPEPLTPVFVSEENSHQQPSPPPTPPSRQHKIATLQKDLSRVDYQISKFKEQRKSLLKELRKLESERPPTPSALAKVQDPLPSLPVSSADGPSTPEASRSQSVSSPAPPTTGRLLRSAGKAAPETPLPPTRRSKRKASVTEELDDETAESRKRLKKAPRRATVSGTKDRSSNAGPSRRSPQLHSSPTTSTGSGAEPIQK